MASALSAPHFHNEEAAYAYVEERLWPSGPVCPHCGGFERIDTKCDMREYLPGIIHGFRIIGADMRAETDWCIMDTKSRTGISKAASTPPRRSRRRAEAAVLPRA